MSSPVTSKAHLQFGQYFIYHITTYSTKIDGDVYKLITLQNIYYSICLNKYFGRFSGHIICLNVIIFSIWFIKITTIWEMKRT